MRLKITHEDGKVELFKTVGQLAPLNNPTVINASRLLEAVKWFNEHGVAVIIKETKEGASISFKKRAL